jgi:uncharacterized lipoprotein
MKKTLVLLGLLTGVSACSLLPDHDEDYRKAQDIAHVTLPPGSATRPLTELYPVPPETVKPTWGKGKFKAPKPMPVAISGVGGELPAAGTGDSTVSLTRDGNGYPSLSASGSFDQVWDTLDQALIAAGVKIDDRNQTLAIYYLQLPDDSGKTSAYQLKVARAVNAYTMALQKDDDTLAPQTVASSLFDKIQTRWHAASGDNSDGKTRPAVHR